MTRRLLLLFSFQIFVIFTTVAQQSYLPEVIPPSPVASSLGKYVEHPVNHYTGLPSIQVPLYEIKGKDLSVDVRLDYHGSGVKVEDVPSNVGSGWSLVSSGYVTRSVRGLPDDLFSTISNVTAAGTGGCDTYDNVGFLYCGNDIKTLYNTTGASSYSDPFYNELRELGMGAKDGVPDRFYFNAGQYSGNFEFDENGAISLIPKQDLRVTVDRQDGKEIIGFKIITPEGHEYIFDKIERTQVTSTGADFDLLGSDAYRISKGPFLNIQKRSSPQVYCSDEWKTTFYNSTWYLSKIKSHSFEEEITFSYRSENTHVVSYTGETLFWWELDNDQTAFRTIAAVSNFVEGQVLEKIEWPEGKIEFSIDPSTPREDMDSRYNNNYAIKNVGIFDKAGTAIKSFELSYSYFVSVNCPNLTDGTSTDYSALARSLCRRLKLDQVKENGKPAYKFYYNNTSLPNRASTMQDFWGYYKPNGSNSLIPIVYEYPDEVVSATSFHTSHFSIYPRSQYTGRQVIHNRYAFDRLPDPVAMKAGILTEIQMPTGGSNFFEYEPNEFYVNGQKVIGGGLRIKKQFISEDNNPSEVFDITKIYDYHDSGKIIDLPQFAAYGPKGIMLHGSWSTGLGISKGSFVTYSQVSEIIPGNGKTTFTYLAPAMYGTVNADIFARPEIEKRYLTFQFRTLAAPVCEQIFKSEEGRYDYYPRPSAPNYDWARGLLDEVKVYDENNNLLKSQKNNYTLKEHREIYNLQVSTVLVDTYALPDIGENGCFAGRHCYNFARSYDISSWYVLESTIETDYAEGSDNVTRKTFSYDGAQHRQVTAALVDRSDNTTMVTRFRYVPDYNIAPGSLTPEVTALKDLQNNNIISKPIETSNYIRKGNVDYLTESVLMGYQMYSGFPKLNNVFTTEITSPVTDFQVSTIIQAALTRDFRYKKKVSIEQYDDAGNPLTVLNQEGIRTSYIWDRGGFAPIAQATNANHDQVFYTSFEPSEENPWDNGEEASLSTDAKTGLYSMNLRAAFLSKNAFLSPGTYIVTYWLKGPSPIGLNMGTVLEFIRGSAESDGWSYCRSKIVVSQGGMMLLGGQQSGDQLVDDFRIYPETSQMTTYLYEPLTGLIETSDPNGRMTTYEYDALKRLQYIREHNSSLSKIFNYHYKGQ
jgi:YD repeat-containing protein